MAFLFEEVGIVNVMKRSCFFTVSLFFIFLLQISERTSALVHLELGENTKVVAHRGASAYAPENTMLAFEKSIEMGADYIELDVQMSKDKQLVVIHDQSLQRTAGENGDVNDYSAQELQLLDVGQGYTIPLLEEVIQKYKDRIGLLIELKHPELYCGIEEELAFLLTKYGLDKADEEQVIVQSFNLESIKKLHALLPDVHKGVLLSKEYYPYSEQLVHEISQFADYVNPKYTYVDELLVAQIHERGLAMMAWTVDDKREAARLIELGIDGIITNKPDVFR